MAIVKEQIRVKRGSTIPLTFSFQDADGSAIPLSDENVRFMVKRKIDEPDNKAIFDTLILIADHSDANNGETYLEIEASESEDFPIGTWYCELRLETTDGDIFPCDIMPFIVDEKLIKGPYGG